MNDGRDCPATTASTDNPRLGRTVRLPVTPLIPVNGMGVVSVRSTRMPSKTEHEKVKSLKTKTMRRQHMLPYIEIDIDEDFVLGVCAGAIPCLHTIHTVMSAHCFTKLKRASNERLCIVVSKERISGPSFAPAFQVTDHTSRIQGCNS